MTEQTTTISEQTSPLFAVLTVVISTAICLLLTEFFLEWRQNKIANSSAMDSGLMRYHRQLGWVLSPSWQGEHHHHDFSVRYTTNSFGFRRGMRDQPFVPHHKASTRTILLGDSFTFGFGANDNETFHAVLQSKNQSEQYVNLGIPGYSTDQQLLLLQANGALLNPDRVVLMYYLGNDLLDNALTYPLQAFKSKPFFSLDGENLQLKNVPVPREAKPAALSKQSLYSIVFGNTLQSRQSLRERWLGNSQLINLLLPQQSPFQQQEINLLLEQRLSKQLQLQTALLSALGDYCKNKGIGLTIALLPGQSYVIAPQSYSAQFQEFVRNTVVSSSMSLGIDTVDIAQKLQQEYSGQRWYHPYEGHFNANGHRQVAELLLIHQQGSNSVKPCTTQSACDTAIATP